MAGEGRSLLEVMGNAAQDLAKASARSLPSKPVCALIHEIVRQRSRRLVSLRVDIASLTSCEVTRVLCKARSAA